MDCPLGSFCASSRYNPELLEKEHVVWKMRRKGLRTELKKINSLIKKLRVLGPDNLDSIILIVRQTNLKKFIDEVVDMMCIARISFDNLPCFVTVVGELHQMYRKFVTEYVKGFLSKVLKTAADPNISDEELIAPAKLICELYMQGIIWDSQELESIFRLVFPLLLPNTNTNSLAVSINALDFLVNCSTYLTQASVSSSAYLPNKDVERNRMAGRTPFALI